MNWRVASQSAVADVRCLLLVCSVRKRLIFFLDRVLVDHGLLPSGINRSSMCSADSHGLML